MKQDYAHIVVVLDRSGSMGIIADDTIGGVNAFLTTHQQAPGVATITLILFDHEYTPVYVLKDVKTAPALTSAMYVPRGNTALLDAVGRAIVETGEQLVAMPEAERPSKVIFVIVTDGQENSSTEYTGPTIKEKITHQQTVYNWEFVFLGANQDAITSAAGLGIAGNSAITYKATGAGVTNVFTATATATAKSRMGLTSRAVFTDADRAAQGSVQLT